MPETDTSAPTPLNLPPSPETPLTPYPTVLKSSPRKNRKIIVAAVASFILVLASFFVVRDYHEWSAIKAVDSYETCVAAKGSTTYDSCPLSCTTRYKDKFIDPSPCPEPALDSVIKAVGDTDTINSWRVFADDNITFKYPADGLISQRNNSLIELMYSPNKYRVRFTFHPATKQSLDKYLTETYLPDADGNHTTSPLKQVQIAGYRGFAAGVYAVDSGWFSYIVLKSPDAKANVDIEYFTDVLKEPADKEVFYQILSTFKFLGQASLNQSPASFYNFVGVIKLNGYLAPVTSRCSFTPEKEACTVKLAFFRVLSSDNTNFSNYLKQLAGNAYVTDDSISLGCLDESKQQVSSNNDSDTGSVESLITGSQYNLLLSSSLTNPVNLSIERPKYTGGRQANDCYSHFRNFRVY